MATTYDPGWNIRRLADHKGLIRRGGSVWGEVNKKNPRQKKAPIKYRG